MTGLPAGPINPALAATFAPPVMEARRWTEGLDLPEGLALINLSQAAPVAPPPEALRAEMARLVMDEPAAHLYGPVLGHPALRARIAADWSGAYGGTISSAQVAVTAGCNQAFAVAVATLAGPGDAVMLPVPWYFNHRMWLQMSGVDCVPLPVGADLMPDPAEAARRLSPAVKAIVLVTPNNPTGAEYPPALIAAFRDLARARSIALIIDETYRDFRSSGGAAHDLFADPDWDETVIHLYSFSKAFRLTGHRVGALLASPARLAQAEKFLDTVTICPPALGQRAALWGLENLGDWLAGERAEILARRAALVDNLARLPGWKLCGAGAYFAYLAHPYEMYSPDLARRLVAETGLLMLPGTMFAPPEGEDGGSTAGREMRLAFANVDAAGLAEVIDRLAAFRP